MNYHPKLYQFSNHSFKLNGSKRKEKNVVSYPNNKKHKISDSFDIQLKNLYNDKMFTNFTINESNCQTLEECINNAISADSMKRLIGIRQILNFGNDRLFQELKNSKNSEIYAIIYSNLNFKGGSQLELKSLELIMKIINCHTNYLDIIATGIASKLIRYLDIKGIYNEYIVFILTKLCNCSEISLELISMDILNKIELLIENNKMSLSLIHQVSKLLKNVVLNCYIDNLLLENKLSIFNSILKLLKTDDSIINRVTFQIISIFCNSSSNETFKLLNEYNIVEHLYENLKSSDNVLQFQTINCFKNIANHNLDILIELEIFDDLKLILENCSSKIKSSVYDLLARFGSGEYSHANILYEYDFWSVIFGDFKTKSNLVKTALVNLFHILTLNCLSDISDVIDNEKVTEFLCGMLESENSDTIIKVLNIFNFIFSSVDKEKIYEISKSLNNYYGISFLEQLVCHKRKEISSISKQLLKFIYP